jgi:hypothetical protein
MLKRHHVTIATLLLAGFALGLLTAPSPAQALSKKALLQTGVMLFGVDWVVQKYGAEMNDYINTALKQPGAAVTGETKVVPVFRLGASGVEASAAAAAQVTGPAEQLKEVTCVLEIERAVGESTQLRALVPLASKENVTRAVKGVGGVTVSAVVRFPG